MARTDVSQITLGRFRSGECVVSLVFARAGQVEARWPIAGVAPGYCAPRPLQGRSSSLRSGHYVSLRCGRSTFPLPAVLVSLRCAGCGRLSGSGQILVGGGFVALVGFCGSRFLPASVSPLVSSVVGSVVASGRGVAVGCAAGADALVRAACPGAQVFSVVTGRWGQGPQAFAARSSALVRAVAASGAGAGMVGFVAGPCPVGVVPARSWRSSSVVSGSWSSLALAAGLGVPVVVFPVGWAWRPPAWAGGSWVPAGRGVWASGWRWAPAARQLFLL